MSSAESVMDCVQKFTMEKWKEFSDADGEDEILSSENSDSNDSKKSSERKSFDLNAIEKSNFTNSSELKLSNDLSISKFMKSKTFRIKDILDLDENDKNNSENFNCEEKLFSNRPLLSPTVIRAHCE